MCPVLPSNADGGSGKDALAYLFSRGLDIRTIRSFGLGYAPGSWEDTRDYLRKKGYTDGQLLSLGIVWKTPIKKNL